MKKLSIPILSVITSVGAAVALGLRIICLFFFYDNIGYYQAGAILPILANVIFAILIAFVAVTAILSTYKDKSVELPSKLSQYAAVFPIGALVFHLVSHSKEKFIPWVKMLINDIKNGVFSSSSFDFVICATMLAIIVSVIFFLFIFLAKKRFNTITFYLGLGALVYVFLCWMASYFDFSIPINSTDKIFFYLGCAGAILFIFSEMCAIYGSVRSRFYYFSLFTAIITLSVSSVSAIVGYVCGLFRAYISLDADIFFVTLLIYAVARLIDAQKSKTAVAKTTEESIASPTDESATDEAEENIADDSE